MSVTFCIARPCVIDGRNVWFHATDDENFALNVSNRNAVLILVELGIEPEPCGSIAPANLHARCVAWRACDEPVFEMATIEERGKRGALMIEMGVHRDYLPTVIGILEGIAAEAMATGGEVGWS